MYALQLKTKKETETIFRTDECRAEQENKASAHMAYCLCVFLTDFNINRSNGLFRISRIWGPLYQFVLLCLIYWESTESEILRAAAILLSKEMEEGRRMAQAPVNMCPCVCFFEIYQKITCEIFFCLGNNIFCFDIGPKIVRIILRNLQNNQFPVLAFNIQTHKASLSHVNLSILAGDWFFFTRWVTFFRTKWKLVAKYFSFA